MKTNLIKWASVMMSAVMIFSIVLVNAKEVAPTATCRPACTSAPAREWSLFSLFGGKDKEEAKVEMQDEAEAKVVFQNDERTVLIDKETGTVIILDGDKATIIKDNGEVAMFDLVDEDGDELDKAPPGWILNVLKWANTCQCPVVVYENGVSGYPGYNGENIYCPVHGTVWGQYAWW